MATIRAKGKTDFGEMDILIEGAGKVERVSSSIERFANFVREGIHRAEGSLANAFYPDPDTMLQAYAFCKMIFRQDDITVTGDIGEMEHKEGVIY